VPAVPRLADRRDHLVVCGDDALAARVIEELTTTYGEDVTVPKSTLCALAMTQDPASPPGPSRRSRQQAQARPCSAQAARSTGRRPVPCDSPRRIGSASSPPARACPGCSPAARPLAGLFTRR